MTEEQAQTQDAAEEVDELSTFFRDERGREWTIKLSVPVVYRFCREHRIRIGEFLPDALDVGQLLDLAFAGTRYQARAKNQTKEDFFSALEGMAFTAAQEAAANAVVNFILLTSLPREDRAAAARQAAADVETVKAAALEAATSGRGGQL